MMRSPFGVNTREWTRSPGESDEPHTGQVRGATTPPAPTRAFERLGRGSPLPSSTTVRAREEAPTPGNLKRKSASASRVTATAA